MCLHSQNNNYIWKVFGDNEVNLVTSDAQRAGWRYEEKDVLNGELILVIKKELENMSTFCRVNEKSATQTNIGTRKKTISSLLLDLGIWDKVSSGDTVNDDCARITASFQ